MLIFIFYVDIPLRICLLFQLQKQKTQIYIQVHY